MDEFSQQKSLKSCIDSLAAKLCIHEVLLKENGNMSEVAKKLSNKNLGSQESIRKRLHRYKNGDPIKKTEFIDALDSVYEGSKYILTHPLWLILANPRASLNEIYQYMQMLHPDIQRYLFNFDAITAKAVRKQPKRHDDMSRVVLRGDLDALAYTLMLVREMDIQDRVHPYYFAMRLAEYAFFLCAMNNKLHPVREDIYGYMHAYSINNHKVFEDIPLIFQWKPSLVEAPRRVDTAFVCKVLEETQQQALEKGFSVDKIDGHEQAFLFLALSEHDLFDIYTELNELPDSYQYNASNHALLSDTFKRFINHYYSYINDRRSGIYRGSGTLMH